MTAYLIRRLLTLVPVLAVVVTVVFLLIHLIPGDPVSVMLGPDATPAQIPATRQALSALFAKEDMPRNCYYGDGSPIPDQDMAHVLAVYARLEVSFPWQRGDVLLVDNVLAAHARNPFTGERKILVALGEMTSFE